MPFARIDLPPSATEQDARVIPQTVHQALVDAFNIPVDDRFQVVARHAAGEVICAPEYLGVRHAQEVVFVQITCAPGRTLEMKKDLYSRIAGGIARGTGFAAADVIINLVESARENWSFGEGIAQYAV